MKNLEPYLFFNGNCKAAMEFYQKILGGELQIFTTGASGQEAFAKLNPDLVLNSVLVSKAVRFMASDNLSSDSKVGDNVYLFLNCSTRAEVDTIYAGLSAGGTPDMTPQDHFWGAYMGSLTDRFGMEWMVNFDEAHGA